MHMVHMHACITPMNTRCHIRIDWRWSRRWLRHWNRNRIDYSVICPGVPSATIITITTVINLTTIACVTAAATTGGVAVADNAPAEAGSSECLECLAANYNANR
jgi:hypothetical protein